MSSKPRHPIYNSSHPLHSIWEAMKRRCYNSKSDSYKYYGRRGIKVCKEWLHSYVTFIEWGIKNGWSKGLQLDRINNDKGYAPSNCRFVTPKENSNNKRAYKSSNKWKTGIRRNVNSNGFQLVMTINNHEIYFGTYASIEIAHLAKLLVKEGINPRPLIQNGYLSGMYRHMGVVYRT